MAVDVIRTLSRLGQTVATCESLTAGLCAATLAGVPGASKVLRGGLITYATELKRDLAGVDPDVLAAVGPVAAATAREMADGAARRCGATWALALTGVAGPDPQDGHPVGELFVGVHGPHGTYHRHVMLSGTRQEIREAAVAVALAELRHSAENLDAGSLDAGTNFPPEPLV
ncbi:competence/damage-inducible protein CinA-like protein [Corynebacterium uterequi]|uniref:Competence/damage-inducible protein CinA-like protein n=1 Tax=Corynebacterium uterequi TaxID=1072256 RepID=A0A0G3HJK9_9CORY|nr:competence/damage-inducible protein CinA-like protein [Corynebacterium uterequi]